MAATGLLASYLPVQVFTLDVKPGEIVPCIEAPSAFRVTMAALDPTAPALPFPENPDAPPRATLKLIHHNTPLDLDDFSDDDDDDGDEDEDGSDVDAIERRLGLLDDEAEFESDEEENGGPSDPEKVKKARLEAVVKQLANGVESDEDEEDVEMANGVNGTKVKKGKMKVTDADELDDDEDELDDVDDDEDDEDESFVVCTLDTMHHYQQPLDLSITHPDAVSFQNVGTHTIYLTGNYFDGPVDDDEESDDDDSDEEEDNEYMKSMKTLLAGLDEEDSESDEEAEESDELDDLDDPRIKELDSDEEDEAPKLVKATGKGKNKRPAESDDEEVENLDDLIKKTLKEEVPKTNGEQKLSKKQLKKLKKNDGQAAPGAQQAVPQKKEESKIKVEEEKKSAIKDSPGNGNGKKVQFAKNLEQGPTGSPKVGAKADGKKEPDEKGVKVVQGVTVDDRKSGTGAAAKKGDRVSMRYIGKLDKDNKVFDSNKKGKPFSFKLGSGEVIKGWDIGVAGMKVGGERRLTIPASLAYGSKSMPGIPSNSTLKFDIKLLSIN